MRISDWSSDVCSSDLIGVLSRVLLFRVPQGRDTDDPDDGPTPLTALINPVLEALGDERVLGWEGCLSIPGLRCEVPRFHRLRVAGLTPAGQIGRAHV